MNRRDIIKTAGLGIAGSAFLPLETFAQNVKSDTVTNTGERLPPFVQQFSYAKAPLKCK